MAKVAKDGARAIWLFFLFFFLSFFFCSSGETLRSVLSYLKGEFKGEEGGIKVLSNRTADLPVVTERAASERSSLAPKCR